MQDHVAAALCLRMWFDTSLRAVWCETQDDITLIWEREACEAVEFVQVKSNELDQLWTVAKLCEPDSKAKEKTGTSIFERSLAYDRCDEPCFFRIVTSRPVKSDLSILTFELDSESRKMPCEELLSIHSEFEKRANGFCSPNGNDYKFWLSRLVWEVVHERDGIRAKNLNALWRVVDAMGELLARDQMEELYEKLVRTVYNAALADPLKERAAKKICRDNFVAWLTDAVLTMVHPTRTGSGKARQKLEAAGLAPETIEIALEERTAYRLERLRPKYLKLVDQRPVELEVQAVLHSLKANLDAGVINDSGPQFHARCLSTLEQVRSEFPQDRRPSRSFVQGFMYSMADRCVHRFTKL